MNNETVYIPPLVVNTPTQNGTYWFRGKIKNVQKGMVQRDIDYPRALVVDVGMGDDGDWWMLSDYDVYNSNCIEGQFELISPPVWEINRSPDF